MSLMNMYDNDGQGIHFSADAGHLDELKRLDNQRSKCN